MRTSKNGGWTYTYATFPAVLYSITGSQLYRENKVVTACGALIHISAAEPKRSASKLATITLNIVIFQPQQDLRFHEQRRLQTLQYRTAFKAPRGAVFSSSQMRSSTRILPLLSASLCLMWRRYNRIHYKSCPNTLFSSWGPSGRCEGNLPRQERRKKSLKSTYKST